MSGPTRRAKNTGTNRAVTLVPALPQLEVDINSGDTSQQCAQDTPAAKRTLPKQYWKVTAGGHEYANHEVHNQLFHTTSISQRVTRTGYQKGRTFNRWGFCKFAGQVILGVWLGTTAGQRFVFAGRLVCHYRFLRQKYRRGHSSVGPYSCCRYRFRTEC